MTATNRAKKTTATYKFNWKLIISHLISFVVFSYHFQGPGWEYETPLPEWSKVDWIDFESE